VSYFELVFRVQQIQYTTLRTMVVITTVSTKVKKTDIMIAEFLSPAV